MKQTTLLLTVAALAAGCHHPPRCNAGTASKIEVRNGSGALQLAWKGDALCDGNLALVGTLEAKTDTVTLRDPAGRPRLELVRESATNAAGSDREGPHLRLYRDAHEARVLRADGVPLGSVVPQTTNGAFVYDPGTTPIGRAQLRDRDAVVTDLQGTALTYVTPASDFTGAGVFDIPHLDPAEQLAVYIYWSR